jgi:hypothetical protein
MFRGSGILRLGLALVFSAFAVMQVLDPTVWLSSVPPVLGSDNTFVYALAIINAVLAVCILFSILPRIAPAIAAVFLCSTLFFAGINTVTIRDAGLALASLSLVFIHEEHIPLRQRLVLKRFFGGH